MARCAAKNFVVRVYFEIFFKQLNLNGEQKEITTCYILIEFFFFIYQFKSSTNVLCSILQRVCG